MKVYGKGARNPEEMQAQSTPMSSYCFSLFYNLKESIVK
jgi:hypothetical protein